MQPERTAAPPSNEDAERALLGSALLDRDVITRISDRVTTEDFYSSRHATIYRAMTAVAEDDQPVDYLTVLDRLDRDGHLGEAGGAQYLGHLAGEVPSPIHAEHYAGLVARTAFMRRLISAGAKIAALGFANQDDPETALVRCEQMLNGTAGTAVASPMVPIAAALSDYVDRLRAVEAGDRESDAAYRLPTTYRDLDALLRGGLARGDLVLLAGRPGMGKSAFGLELVARIALAYKIRVALFSLEMGNSQVLARMLSTTSGVPLARFDDGRMSPSQEAPFGTALGRLAGSGIVLDDSSRLSISTLRSRVRRLAGERAGLDLVVVDHVQLLSGRGENRVAEIGDISRGLKAIAREHNVAVIALAQLSRAVEQRTDKVPQLSDLRESGTLEQDADVVMMLYREEYYKPETERTGVADLYVPKHRNGRTGKLTLLWNDETTGFRGMEDFGL